MKLNLGSGRFPLDGFVNLDLEQGFVMERHLAALRDESVEAITISHALMYVPLEEWPDLLRTIARVLEYRGVVRVTEDEVHLGHRPLWHDAITSTGHEETFRMLDATPGLRAYYLDGPEETRWSDGSLIQEHHGAPPEVFHVEAVKG